MADLRLWSSASNIVRFCLKDSSTGQGKTGLSTGTTALVVSTIADNEASATAYSGSNLETITTLGTFATPTSGKCRFKEVDSSNHKGLYEFQFADARFAVTSAKRLVVSVNDGESTILDTDYEIELVQFNPFDAVRLGLTALPSVASGSAGAIITSGTGTAQLSVSSGVAQADMAKILGTTSTGTAGYVGIDWAHVLNPGSSVGLSGTSINIVGSVTSGVNVTSINSVSTSSVTTVSANVGTAQPLNFTGTSTSALVKVDVQDFGGAAGTFASGKPAVTLASTDVTGNVASDVQTIKTQTVTCAAGVTVNVNVGTTQPVNFSGTGSSALVKDQVGGYASGQDPATLVLDVAQSGHNTAGTIGADIGAGGGGTADVNIVSVNGSTFAGANVPSILADGVAHGGTLGSSTATIAFSEMVGQSQTENTSAFRLTGNGSGDGLHILGGNSGGGAYFQGGSTGGPALNCYSPNSHGFSAVSNSVFGSGIYARSNDTGFGMSLVGKLAGLTIYSQNSNGIEIYTGGVGGHGILVEPTDGDGIHVAPTLSVNTAATGISVVGAGTGPAIQLGDGTAGAQALLALAGTGGGANMDAVKGVGQGTGAGFVSVPDAVGFFTLTDVATAVWTDLAAAGDFGVPGSIGDYLVNQGVTVGDYVSGQNPASLVLSAVAADFAASGTVGGLLNTALDVPISSRSDYAGGPVSSVTGDVAGKILGGGAGTIIGVGAAIDAPTNFTSLAIDTGGRIKVQSGLTRNTACPAFGFVMLDSTNHEPTPGLTVTATRRIDSGSFAACANPATGVANGWYTIALAASDLNGARVDLRFTATGADDRDISVFPTP